MNSIFGFCNLFPAKVSAKQNANEGTNKNRSALVEPINTKRLDTNEIVITKNKKANAKRFRSLNFLTE